VNLPEIHLRTAAGAIDGMSNTELQQALRKLKQRRNARTPMEVALQQTELASFELEQAAYQLAGDAEAKGDLSGAARWYTAAASNDFGDASLRLAKILDALAERHLQARDGKLATREERHLVTEACRWYSDALAAGELEADELLEKLMDRHFGKSRRSTAPGGAVQPGSQPSTAPQLHPPSNCPAGGPDRVPGTDVHRIRARDDAASAQSADDRRQPGPAVACKITPENEGR
jgi:hypothetical protein